MLPGSLGSLLIDHPVIAVAVVFVGGVVTSLTPCIYPMIPITAAIVGEGLSESVALGESSHRPASPNEVLRRRFGDCKDKSLLLITLLRELGIDSKPVLLQIGRHMGLEKTLPSPQFFDHAIVQAALNGKTFFLDPTRLGQRGLLERMGQLHEGTEVGDARHRPHVAAGRDGWRADRDAPACAPLRVSVVIVHCRPGR